MGILLITQSGISKFPLINNILGWITLIAAIILVLIGRKKFNLIMMWFLALPNKTTRVAGLFALGFGAFLPYAFI